MKKRVVDLTAEELDKFAREAWGAAAAETLAKGLPVTGARNGRLFRHYPDGHEEDLGPVASLAADQPAKKRRTSAA
jgi:hypothetical protein